MRFYFFHLMPWPHLPEDFTEKHPSAWVTLSNNEYDPDRGSTLYHRYLDELCQAEELGFDGICVNEHHQTAYGLMPSPNIMAAALAVRTKRARIAILGNALPLRGNPLRVAEEVAMIDVLSGGRVICGFVRGTGAEYHSCSINPLESRDRFTEAFELIMRAWTEPGPFRHDGKHFHFRYVNPWPQPLQKPHPPVWIPSNGTPDTIRWAARMRYAYCQTYAPVEQVRQSCHLYHEAAQTAGYTADPEQIGWALPLYVGETDAQAHAEARPHMEYLFHKLSHRTVDLYFPVGYVPDKFRLQLLKSRTERFGLTYTDLIEKGYCLVGSAATVRQQLAALQQDLKFGNLIAFLQFGSLPHHLTLQNLNRFAQDVMPHLRDGNDRLRRELRVAAPAQPDSSAGAAG